MASTELQDDRAQVEPSPLNEANMDPREHGTFPILGAIDMLDRAEMPEPTDPSEGDFEDDDLDPEDFEEQQPRRPRSVVLEVAMFFQSSLRPVSRRHPISTSLRARLGLDTPVGDAQLVWLWSWAQLALICSLLFLSPRGGHNKNLLFLSLAWCVRCATRVMSARLSLAESKSSGGKLAGSQLEDRRERMDDIGTFITIVWFVWAHCALYETSPPKRLSCPHVWWLVFGILFTNYLMIVEANLHRRVWRRFLILFIPLFAIGLIILGLLFSPVIFFFVQYFWRRLSRQGSAFNDGTRLPKALVDRIPLVVYIPPPPNEVQDGIDASSMFNLALQYAPSFAREPIKRLQLSLDFVLSYLYPKDEPMKPFYPRPGSAWETQWERCDYPFIKLPPNRAVCSICLLDFEPPRTKEELRTAPAQPSRRRGEDRHRPHPSNTVTPEPHSPISSDQQGSDRGETMQVDENQGEGNNDSEDNESVLEDNFAESEDKDGPRPLRLLDCGHAFHKTCLDTWLLRGNLHGSRRCPVCKRFIEVPRRTG